MTGVCHNLSCLYPHVRKGPWGQGVRTLRNRLSPGAVPRPVFWAQGPPAGTTHLTSSCDPRPGQSRLGRTEKRPSAVWQAWGQGLGQGPRGGKGSGGVASRPSPTLGAQGTAHPHRTLLGGPAQSPQGSRHPCPLQGKEAPPRSCRSPPGTPAQAPSSLLLAGGSAPVLSQAVPGRQQAGASPGPVGGEGCAACPAVQVRPGGPWEGWAEAGARREHSGSRQRAGGRRGRACRWRVCSRPGGSP